MPKTNLNVLEIVFSDMWGGGEMNACRFANDFRNLGHNVYMVMLPGTKMESYCKESKIPHRPINRFFRYLDVIAAWKIARIIKEKNIDILHAHKSTDLSILALSKKFAGRSHLVFTQEFAPQNKKQDFFHRWVYNQVEMVVGVSEFVRKSVLDNYPVIHGQTRCIYNGVDLKTPTGDGAKFRKSLFIPEDSLVVGIAARIEPLKNIHLLVESGHEIVDRCKNVYFVIAGEIPESGKGQKYYNRLKNSVDQKGLSSCMFFAGHVENIQSFYDACDLTIQTSDREAFGLTVIESMAAGVPVIAAEAGGPVEIINDGKDGLFFKPGSSESLAEKVVWMLHHHAARRKMKHKARLRVENYFDVKKRVEEYERLFYSLQRPHFID